jgi:hypothetical protein
MMRRESHGADDGQSKRASAEGARAVESRTDVATDTTSFGTGHCAGSVAGVRRTRAMKPRRTSKKHERNPLVHAIGFRLSE